MAILELLQTVENIAQEKGYSKPLICGGTPRDKVLGLEQEIVDLDITTGDNTVHALARSVAEELSKTREAHFKVLSDGHAQIQTDELKLDFSSNYRVPGIRPMLKQAGKTDPSELLMELLSRDFTCNALVMTMDLKTIKDPTGLGLVDIKAKKLRTCLPARITLGNDHKRVVRVLYLAAKLDFDVDEEIIDWIKNHPETIADVKPKYLSDKLQKALNYNEEKVIKLMDQMNVWSNIPPLPALIPYIGKRLV